MEPTFKNALVTVINEIDILERQYTMAARAGIPAHKLEKYRCALSRLYNVINDAYGHPENVIFKDETETAETEKPARPKRKPRRKNDLNESGEK